MFSHELFKKKELNILFKELCLQLVFKQQR